MKKTTKQKLARYITPFMHKILTTFSFVLLTVAFSSSFANADTTTISNFYQLKLEVEKLKFMQAQHKPNNYIPQIQALENQLNQLKNNFDANNTDVNRQFTHSKELTVRQDERIVDFNSHLFWSGILVTALLVFISIGGFFFSYKKADIELKKWAEEDGIHILEKEAVPIRKKLEEMLQKNKNLYDEGKKKINSLETPTKEEQRKVNERVKEIKKKLDSQYSFDDLFNLHLDSYYRNNPEQSLEYANQALKIPLIKPEQKAEILLHKGSIFEGLRNRSTLEGLHMEALGEQKEAIDTFTLVIDTFENSTETILLERVAQALLKKGTILGESDKLNKAIIAFDLVIDKFKDSTETTLLEQVAHALVQKGAVLNNKGDPNGAIKTFTLVIEKFEGRTETTFSEQVATALVQKGILLEGLGKLDEAIKTFNSIIKQFKDSTETTLLKKVEKASAHKRILSKKLDELVEAIKTCDSTIEQFKDRTETTLLEKVAIALVNKGNILGESGRLDEAIETFNLVEQFKDRTETTLLEKVAIALVNKGVVLSMRGRSNEAMEAFSLVIERFEGRKEITLLENVAKAFVNKGIALNMRGRSDKAIETYGLVIDLFKGRKETILLEQVAIATKNKKIVEQNR